MNKWKLLGGGVLAAIIAIAVAVVLLWAKANWFEDGNYLVTEKGKVDHVIRFEAAGGNIRYYVITPPGPENSHMSCGISAGEKSPTQGCWVKQGWVMNPSAGWINVGGTFDEIHGAPKE